MELGLGRMARLVGNTVFPWRAIHVAGTNGKGSVCAYAAGMLQASGASVGRFTSPHFLDRWDCINLDGRSISKETYESIRDRFRAKDAQEKLGATEFEFLTATAFQAFTEQKVDVGVVEVGLGGRLDSTNVLRDPLATVITKIGMDHTAILGDALEKIAREKAGIMKPGVPCIVDGTNPSSVKQVIERHGAEVDAGPISFVLPDSSEYMREVWSVLPHGDYEQHQRVHVVLAYEAVKSALAGINNKNNNTPPLSELVSAVARTAWQGRLQFLDVSDLTGRTPLVLLDGAHNPQSASILGEFVRKRLRRDGNCVTWVLAASKGKDICRMFGRFLQEGDQVVAVAFTPVDGMDWVEPVPPDQILEIARGTGAAVEGEVSGSVLEALQRSTELAKGGPLVIAGSLYLVSDVLRLMRALKN